MLGLLIGSFLNVVIVRVPQGLSVVRPGSTCVCGEPVAPRDNVPVLSWLLLRGRARCCGAPIGVRYPVIEAFTAVSFAAVAGWVAGPGDVTLWVLPALLYLVAVCIALAAIDLEHYRLPDALTLPSYGVGLVLLVLPSVADDQLSALLRALACGAGFWLCYFLLWFLYPQGMGFGDVKFSGVLGLYLGWFGVGQAFVGWMAGFVLGGVLGITLMALGLATRKSQIPFGPYMIAGAWVGLVVGGPVADWYLRSMGL
ncbi:prepilin peptidase [Spongisporangium articulatum]|uniref:Prepilin leader peptidase/N-methyltransferase n=1 Tax=Spongisporangium articulatum TaxID=3362603 RepID=A0ABW8AR79_9ACTN